MRTLMNIRVNGEPYQARDGVTVSGLLEDLQVNPLRVAVEVNLEIVRKAHFATRMLREGDAVEVVNFVGGG